MDFKCIFIKNKINSYLLLTIVLQELFFKIKTILHIKL